METENIKYKIDQKSYCCVRWDYTVKRKEDLEQLINQICSSTNHTFLGHVTIQLSVFRVGFFLIHIERIRILKIAPIRLNPATSLSLSQARPWISNTICRCLLFMFRDMKWLCVLLNNIGGILDHHCLINFLFGINNTIIKSPTIKNIC